VRASTGGRYGGGRYRKRSVAPVQMRLNTHQKHRSLHRGFAMQNRSSGYGPCVVCGDMNYPLSMGGPSICPKCDCGQTDAATVIRQTKIIADLRKQLEEEPSAWLAEFDTLISVTAHYETMVEWRDKLKRKVTPLYKRIK